MNEMTMLSDDELAKLIADAARNPDGREFANSITASTNAVSAISVLLTTLNSSLSEVASQGALLDAERDTLKATHHARVAELQEIISTLRNALKPFATCAQLFPDIRLGDEDQPVYAAAAGKEFTIYGNDLRRALRAYESTRID